MALTVAGEDRAAQRAFGWALDRQRHDGSWAMKYVAGSVEDASGETNMSAYLAVAVWHHWLVRRDPAFVARCWPAVRRGLDWVVSMQLPFGGIAWAQEWSRRPAGEGARGRLAGCVVQRLPVAAGRGVDRRADGRPAAGVGAGGRPAAARAARAPRPVPRQVGVLDGLVLPGPGRRGPRRRGRGAAGGAVGRVRGARARRPLRLHQPVGDRRRDLRAGARPRGARATATAPLRLFADVQHLRVDDGRYWTGWSTRRE